MHRIARFENQIPKFIGPKKQYFSLEQHYAKELLVILQHDLNVDVLNNFEMNQRKQQYFS
jgi:hypothetical protein